MNQETGIQKPDAGQMEMAQAPQGQGGMEGVAPRDTPGGPPPEQGGNQGGEATGCDCGGHEEGAAGGCSCEHETDSPGNVAQAPQNAAAVAPHMAGGSAAYTGAPAPQAPNAPNAQAGPAAVVGFQDMGQPGPMPAQPQYQFQPGYQAQQSPQYYPPQQQPQYQAPAQGPFPGLSHPAQGPAPAMGPQSGHMPGQGCGHMGATADHVHHDENRFGQMADVVGRFIKGEATTADMVDGLFSLNFRNDQFWKGALLGAAAIVVFNSGAVQKGMGKLFGRGETSSADSLGTDEKTK